MATQRLIRNLTNTATGGTVAADDYLALSGATNDGRKILVSEVANYVATEEGGSTLAQLSSGKVPASQLPSGFDAGNYLGLWDANANSPALSNGSGTQGDYYIVGTAGTTSIDGISSWAVGDEIRANASAWEKLTPGTTAVTQGGTGATTAEGARTNLEVDSKDEAAEGLTRNEPSLYLDGSNDFITVAHDPGLAFGDGTNDLPWSMSLWMSLPSVPPDSTGIIIEKSDANAGWYLKIANTGILTFYTRSSSSNQLYRSSSASLATVVGSGEWFNLTLTLDGSGPSYSDTLQNALDSLVVYINNEPFAFGATIESVGSKAGYESDGGRNDDNEQNVVVGGFGGSVNLECELRNVQIFNTALTADQVEQVYRSGVPFELSQAQAGDSVTDGGFENWDSATDLTNWQEGSAGTSTINRESTVVDSGTYAVRLDLDSSSNYAAVSQSGILTVGKLYNVTVRARGDGSAVGLQFGTATDGAAYHNTGHVFTSSYATYSFTITAIEETFSIGRQAGSAASSSIYIDNISIREAGAILDLNAADVTGTNLPDRSGNGYNGTLNNMTIADNAVNLPPVVSTYHPNPASGEALLTLGNGGSGSDFSVDEDWTGTWTPGLSFGGNPAGNVYSLQEGHFSKVGNIVIATFAVALSSKGSGSGTARISGLPFLGKTIAAANLQSGAIGFASGFSGLVGALSGLIQSNQDDIILTQHGGATGTSTISDTEFTSSSELRGTFIYLTD